MPAALQKPNLQINHFIHADFIKKYLDSFHTIQISKYAQCHIRTYEHLSDGNVELLQYGNNYIDCLLKGHQVDPIKINPTPQWALHDIVVRHSNILKTILLIFAIH
jgi:hypothetical protein